MQAWNDALNHPPKSLHACKEKATQQVSLAEVQQVFVSNVLVVTSARATPEESCPIVFLISGL